MSPNQPSAFNQFGEHHTIETPEQTRLEFAIAGIGSRFLALALDLLIQAAAGIVLFFGFAVLLAVFGGRWRSSPAYAMWIGAIFIALVFGLHFGYFIFFEIWWNGQTPGKRKVGIRVVKDSGRPLTPAETVARNLLRIVDELPGFYGVAIATALFNAQNRRVGDFVAGSLVVREASLADLRPSWTASPSAAAAPLFSGARLAPEDLALIDAFLARRSELPGDVRSRMAKGILERVKPKLPSGPDPGLSAESNLERLAYECRASGGYV
jgi:uncharacterized RDD family membrane protein YckC